MKKALSLFLSVLMLISAMSLASFEGFAASGAAIQVSLETTEMYDYANEVLTLVNKEREANGLKPLVMDRSLLDTAMLRATELIVFFNHTRPNGGSCFSANSKMNGENIAAGYVDPADVMDGWMHSDGHRSNILHSSFKSVGIGCIKYGQHYYWTQCFSTQDGVTVTKKGNVAKTASVDVQTSNISLSFNSSTSNINNSRYPDGFTPQIVSINKGGDAIRFPIDASLLNFKSSDNSVFTVSSNGTIKIVSSGTATFTAALKADPDVILSQELTVTYQACPNGHTLVTDKAVAPTCTKTGLTEGKHCSVCGQVTVEQKTVAATGHKYSIIENYEPSCTETGFTIYTCEICAHSYMVNGTELADHTIVTQKAVAPTCTESGLTEGKYCSVCGDVIAEQKTVPATGHKYTSTVIAPTCTEQGYTAHICSACGDRKLDNYTPALGHTIVEKNKVQATCTSNGYTGDKVCTRCNTVVTKGSTTTALGHNYVASVEKATVDKDGKIVNTCSRCGNKTIVSTISKVADVKLSRTEITYVGTVQRPTVTVKDSKGNSLVYKQDFTVDYSDWYSADAGEYTVTVNFIGNYEGSKTYTYKILPQSNAAPKLNRYIITTNGTVQRPLVTVTDKNGNALTYKKDFTVDYSDWYSTDVGRYTVTVKMQGNYSGSYTYPYYINPKPTTFLSSAQGGFKGLKNGFTLTWNKQNSQTTGYQIQYATKRDFSNAASYWVEDPEITTATITGRAANTRYYVRIRPYTQIGNGTFYGSWDYEDNYIKSIVTM